MNNTMTYEPTIGLEIHAELTTRTKMFCDSLNDPDEVRPNVNVCPVCLGHPGTLPTINKQAVESVIKVGLALGGNINLVSKFDRKNYFYPDLPKGYQISQYDQPLVVGGELLGVRIRRVHLEEDTGRLVHGAPRSNSERMETNENRIVLKDESYRLMGLLFKIHNKLGPVFKEKNYQDAVEEVLKRERIVYEREKKVELRLDGVPISDFYADFIIDGKILLETKATKFITQDDIRQILRYIKSADLPLGIIVNFRKGNELEYKRLINPKFDKNSIAFDTNVGESASFVDFNRAGVPLMELVTEPDLRSGEDVVRFAKELQLILRYLGISDADMEKGQLRIEANVSLNMGTKVELKNINSFRAVGAAITYELKRQREELEGSGTIQQETRGWDEARQRTFSQRSKEEAHDYRYFPEPDLPPLETSVFNIEDLRRHLPELPVAKRERFTREFGFSESQSASLVDDKELADFYEAAETELARRDEYETNKESKRKAQKLLYNYLASDLKGLINETGTALGDLKIPPEHLAHLVDLISDGMVMSRGAKDILKKMVETGSDPEEILNKEELHAVSDGGELETIVREVLSENPAAVADYKKGKAASLQFLVGKAMGKLKGRGNPEALKELFLGKLA